MLNLLPASMPSLPLPPGFCSVLEPDLIWLHLIADVSIGVAYMSIPAALVVFGLRRSDLAYPWLLGLFALFIVACGATHLMHAWTMFRPDYALEGLIKAFCAAVSVATAITLWPLLPKLLALPSPATLAREVEERRAAEARAVASEARMAAFIDHLAEALFVIRVEPDGGFVTETVNPAFERLFGVSARRVIGQRADQAVTPEVAAAVLPRWREGVATGRPATYEIEADTPAGHRVWQTVLVPMAGADGRVERLLGSARDVTATRRLQAGLVQSARMATVGSMCAGLAHETSQPLNAALLWLRHARAAAPSGDPRRLEAAFSVVESQLRRAGDLIARIRALAGAEHAEAQEFDAARSVAAAVETAAGQYAPEGIEVTLANQSGPLPVNGVAGRLEQAVLQLLANARDAVLERRAADHDAPAHIAVRLRSEGREAVLEVRDSGPGVPEQLRDSIFDPFFTTKEPGRGTGLGLSLAASVARAMGGRIEVRNRRGGGACFTMSLALAPEPPRSDRMAEVAVC
jgi:PAS domain S-box-containing protein